MVKGIGHRRGSMNPWAESEDYYDKPNWTKFNGHETPFGVIAELLQSWPGSSQTSEQSHEERHLRLISVIAGYPEILTGRRPLDIPLHKKSELAFRLSEFLDKIRPDSESEWHSLRTLLLHHDLVSYGNGRERKTAKEILECMVISIRNYSTFGDTRESYPSGRFHDEELMFLTALHSQSIERIGRYWTENLRELNLNPKPLQTNQIHVNSTEKRRNYVEHVFKFDEIHRWINKWSTPADRNLFHKNVGQKWIIAASAILESLFAKLRSHIIDEKRPGSIVIDGGGRISYISRKTREDEQQWFKKILYTSFLQSLKHPHPYAKTITQQIQTYAEKKEGVVLKKIEHYVKEEDQVILWSDREEDKDKPTKSMFQVLIGEEAAMHFIPPVVVDPSKGRDEQSRFLIDYNAPKPWMFSECVICNHEHTGLENVSSCKEIIEHNHFVCPFHFLFGGLAESVIVRQTSFADLYLKQYESFSEGEEQISHILRFDGNSIGLTFEREFEDFDRPEYDTYSEIWENECDNILNINERWNLPKQHEHLSEREKNHQKHLLFNRRLQVFIRKQRRSYSFNSKWWTALRGAMWKNRDCNLIPWILAGDDIVLVNQSKSKIDSICSFLNDFHTKLHEELGERITFAGSLQRRESLSITDGFHKAESLEKLASTVWKKLASSDFPDLLNDKKREELEKEWNPAVHSEIHDWIKSRSAFQFRFGSREKPNSIIIPSNWKDYSSS